MFNDPLTPATPSVDTPPTTTPPLTPFPVPPATPATPPPVPMTPPPAPVVPPMPPVTPVTPPPTPSIPTPPVTPVTPPPTPVVPPAPPVVPPAPVAPVTAPATPPAPVTPTTSGGNVFEGKGSGKYKVVVIKDKCIGAASCVAVAPKSFKLNDQQIAEVLPTVTTDSDDTLLLSAQSCPTSAIEVYDTTTGEKVWPK